MSMDRPTKDEIRYWFKPMAARYGVDPDELGQVRLLCPHQVADYLEPGRPVPTGPCVLIVTPYPADRYDQALVRKPVPVRFDRAPGGELLLPGYWWERLFRELSERADRDPTVRALARLAAQAGGFGATRLHPRTLTSLITIREADGTLIPTECLRPGQLLVVPGPAPRLR